MFRYLTTPIYYVNDRPHLGHFYTTVAADILARFYKMQGDTVKFVTGTDEHGAKVAQAAEKKGLTPQAYVDTLVTAFQDMTREAGAEPDDFIRTTEPRHYKAAQALWKDLENRGQIYLGYYEGWYAVRDEAFYDETELVQTAEGKKAPTGALVEWVQEPCYFFRLSHWQEPLIAYYKSHPQAIGPESRYNEVMAFLKGGLKDLAVSRSKLSWGIPIPECAHVMYVWIDALTNYLTVLGYPDLSHPDFENFWPQSTHLIGKDILRFHAVYWPAFLMALGIEPPHRIFAHGWWTCEGEKMSKSLGNVIDPKTLVETYGLDKVRYFLFRHVRFGQDGDFCEDLFVGKCNQELSDGLGNLAYRVLSFIQSRCQGKLPPLGELGVREKELFYWGKAALPDMCALIDKQDLYGYLEYVYQGVVKGNQYMTQLAPWALIRAVEKGDQEAKEKMETGLSALVHFLRDLALFLWPVMPSSCRALLEQVGARASGSSLIPSFSELAEILKNEILPQPSPLFKRIEEE